MVKWYPPWGQFYKANIDGAVLSHQKEAGVGIIIWDIRGRVVAALSKKVSVPLGAMEFEADAFE